MEGKVIIGKERVRGERGGEVRRVKYNIDNSRH